jgi:siderophore synthetase component
MSTYLTKRLIDTCLREDLFGLVSQASLRQTVLTDLSTEISISDHPLWLYIQQPHRSIYISVEPSHYMQDWLYAGKGWLEVESNQAMLKTDYPDWITLLKSFAGETSRSLLDSYLEELHCAKTHGALCHQAFLHRSEQLSNPISEHSGWERRMLLADQIASYLDHPYYPTARAKFGLSESELQRYAPEFSPQFELNWLAIEKSQVVVTSPTPECWPKMNQVGLPESLAETHVLFPVHPLTLSAFSTRPNGVIVAPHSALEVAPTLSVRTVAVLSQPDVHIKVPLVMRTLGSRNIRLIKPSTIYDGFWFERLLSHLEASDPQLQGCYCHCHEQHGGHLGEEKAFSYIVRQYPLAEVSDKALVPVAALAAPMPDGRLFLQHLADQYYAMDVMSWFTDYVDLLNRVHLTLWLRYGIALESNQQNAVLAFAPNGRMSLLMKDNDAARIWPERFQAYEAASPVQCATLLDRRILVDDELALGQMYTTITLQLDIAAIVEAMDQAGIAPCHVLYKIVQQSIVQQLEMLELSGCETDFARKLLLDDERLFAKYLLSSGSLLSKEDSGAADINKFYGLSAPNFLTMTSENIRQVYLDRVMDSKKLSGYEKVYSQGKNKR